jgi:hypothetical protein
VDADAAYTLLGVVTGFILGEVVIAWRARRIDRRNHRRVSVPIKMIRGRLIGYREREPEKR